ALDQECEGAIVASAVLALMDAEWMPPAVSGSLPRFHKVAGTCPACSGSTLMLGAGDHVTCSWIGCPDPMAARRRLAPLDDAAIERAARAMFKRVYPGSWTWTDDQRYAYMASARVALAAAEETPHG
ncbi:MAG: hypothetical protein IT190_08210, partial [Microbacteriaceae bacterium]|nr:hypothetical protein [Microbacteriaceae bacterium]